MHCQSNIKSQSCGLCKISGHQRQQCPKLKALMNVNGSKLIASSQDQMQLNSNLSSNGYFQEIVIHDSLQITTANEFPKGMKGIILHMTCRTIQQRYVKCTVLIEKLDCHHIYDNFFFDLVAVQKYISKCSLEHVVISRLVQNVNTQLSQSLHNHSFVRSDDFIHQFKM